MNILVTGANGFVGRYLCALLRSRGHKVRAVVRSATCEAPDVDELFFVSDLTDSVSLSELLVGCDCVVHLAARAHLLNDKSTDPLSEFRLANVSTTVALATCAANVGVKRFVYVSSIGVNGQFTKGIPFSESQLEHPHDDYALSKLEAENALRDISNKTGIEYVIVRPPLVYGPDAPGNFALLLKLVSYRIPLPFGRVHAKRSLISVWNLVDFLCVCVEHQRAANELFLVADNEDLTLAEILKFLAVGMNHRLIFLPVGPVFLKTVASLFGRRLAIEKLTSDLVIDHSKILDKLGWRAPISASEALTNTGFRFIAR